MQNVKVIYQIQSYRLICVLENIWLSLAWFYIKQKITLGKHFWFVYIGAILIDLENTFC